MQNRLKQIGLDPDTRTYQTSKSAYQLQNPVNTTSSLAEDSLNKTPEELKDILNQTLSSRNQLDVNGQQISDRIIKGIDTQNPEEILRGLLEKRILTETGTIPVDLHTGNVGFSGLNLDPKVIDSGFFKDAKNISPEAQEIQRKALEMLKSTYKKVK